MHAFKTWLCTFLIFKEKFKLLTLWDPKRYVKSGIKFYVATKEGVQDIIADVVSRIELVPAIKEDTDSYPESKQSKTKF